jgi:hypothetical protein
MYVCMYVCMYVFMYVCMYVDLCIHALEVILPDTLESMATNTGIANVDNNGFEIIVNGQWGNAGQEQ